MNNIVQNALLNAFVEYYHDQHFNGYLLGYIFVDKKTIRRVNIHMKLTGRNWQDEMLKFITGFEQENENYDFALELYEDGTIEDYWNFKKQNESKSVNNCTIL